MGVKMSLIGSLAALFAKVPVIINAYTGLGYVFSANSKTAHIIRCLLIPAIRFLQSRKNTWAIFQNRDDKELFFKYRLVKNNRTAIIKGSGVDANHFVFSEEPPEPVLVMLASRMLWDKGIGEFIEAAKELKPDYPNVRFVLTGDIDNLNPMSLTLETIIEWVKYSYIEWIGYQKNMLEVLSSAHIVVLPSYREGLPKVLLEAASVGRPIVATDAPGCREIARDGVNGILVPVKDSVSLGKAIEKLILNKSLRKKMGLAGRKIIERELSSEIINSMTLDLYDNACLMVSET